MPFKPLTYLKNIFRIFMKIIKKKFIYIFYVIALYSSLFFQCKSVTLNHSKEVYEIETNKGRNSFLMDANEVTVEEYIICVNTKKCGVPQCSKEDEFCNWLEQDKKKHPVNYVSLYQAYEYCQWKNKRLPTKVEWQRAAGLDHGFTYPWGNKEPDCSMGSFVNHNCDVIFNTAPVRSNELDISPYGIYDMAGSVREWLNEEYQDKNVAQGGSFASTKDGFKILEDNFYTKGYVSYEIGFRCVAPR